MTDELNRRDAFKLLAAGAATVAAGCANAHKQEGHTMSQNAEASAGDILAVEPLGFPWHPPDPFLFCVHHDDAYPAGNERMGPATSLAGRPLGNDFEGIGGWRMYHGHVVPGFPQHPHRGFETVTVVRQGLLDHSDSLGATARYGRGDVQWLTAGKGILHAEMFPLVERDNHNPLELFQIWMNLPSADKLVEPHFTMLWGDQIPRLVTRDEAGRSTEVAIMAGRIGEHVAPAPPPRSWAARPSSDVAIWTIKLAPGARYTLPPALVGTHRTLFFFRGSGLRIGARAIASAHSISLRPDASVVLEAGPDEAEVLLLQGRPIGEPVVNYGPFVMNTRAEIQQAISDYQRTQFGGWPWPSDDPVHGREEGRFARHANGKVERPA